MQHACTGTICKPSNQTVNRHRLYDIMVPTKWFTRRAEKGFSKKILLLCALSESNSSAINKLYTRNKKRVFIPCKLPVVFAGARTYHYYYYYYYGTQKVNMFEFVVARTILESESYAIWQYYYRGVCFCIFHNIWQWSRVAAV